MCIRDRYLIGDAQYLDVLNSITGQQQLQRNLLSAQLDLRLIRVSLYLALAGNIDPNCREGGFIGEGFIEGDLQPINVDSVEPASPGEGDDVEDLELELEPERTSPSPAETRRPSQREGDAIADPTPMPKPDKPLLDRLRGTIDDE